MQTMLRANRLEAESLIKSSSRITLLNLNRQRLSTLRTFAHEAPQTGCTDASAAPIGQDRDVKHEDLAGLSVYPQPPNRLLRTLGLDFYHRLIRCRPLLTVMRSLCVELHQDKGFARRLVPPGQREFGCPGRRVNL